MSGNVDKVFRALSSQAPKIEVKRDSFFGPRKVVVNGEECLLKDLMNKINGRAIELRIIAKEHPEDLNKLHLGVHELHKVIGITADLEGKDFRTSFYRWVGVGRQKELSEVSDHLRLIDRFVQFEESRKMTTLSLIMGTDEDSLKHLQKMDRSILARDFHALESHFSRDIQKMSGEERAIAEKKMAAVRDYVSAFITKKTLGILLDGDEKWNVAELKKMDLRLLADNFSKLEAEQSSMDPTVQKKLEQLREMVDYIQVLKADNFKGYFINEVVCYRLELKNEKISDGFPASLELGKGATAIEDGVLFDSNGEAFDHLFPKRDEKGVLSSDTQIDRFNRFTKDRGGDFKIIREWHEGQSGDSWSLISRKFKNIFNGYRNVADAKVWKGPCSPKATMRATEQERKTALMYVSYIAEGISKVDFPGKNPDGTITLYRTESKEVLEMNKIFTPSSDTHTIPRGFAESGSIIAPVVVHGTEVTVQKVPFHRFVAFYMFFPVLSAGEKEGVFMCDGIPFTYTHTAAA